MPPAGKRITINLNLINLQGEHAPKDFHSRFILSSVSPDLVQPKQQSDPTG
jgi:hypothetical protein